MLFQKILDNIGLKAARLLGIKQYINMLFQFIGRIPTILKEKNLVALDKRMSNYVLSIDFNNYHYLIDLPYIDNQIIEGSFAYGGVREIFIRNCYFRHHDIDFSKIKTVIDLGGNRGLFSTFCAAFASKIIVIEPNPVYNEVIAVNINNVNPQLKPVIINKFVGGKGLVQRANESNISFDQIITEHVIGIIDFLKIDIEGSEFGLFEDGLPFDKIRYLSLEVHRDYGDPEILVRILKDNGFNVIASTANFKRTASKNEIDYIYAQNIALLSKQSSDSINS